MAPKLMAFDLDGTLVFDGRIAQSSVDAIRRWQAAGHLAVCATGKSIAATRFALEGTGLEFDYYVLYTGGAVTDRDFTVLKSSVLPNDAVRAIVERMTRTEGVAVYGTALDLPADVRFPSTTGDKASSILAHFQPMEPTEIPDHEFVGVPLWIEDDEPALEQTRSWLLEEFAGRLDCHRNQDFLDIVPPGCTKGTGLTWLDDAHLGGRYETYSIGDSWNDLPMHAWAEHSASFGYSPREVQAATDVVVAAASDYVRSVLTGEQA